MRAGGWMRMAAAAAAAGGAMLLLALLPIVPGGARDLDRPAFRTELPAALGLSNLIDSLQALGLGPRLERVEWNGSVLRVDLRAREGSFGDTLWRDDLRGLAELCFVRSSNVTRLLARLQSEEGSLAAAADMRRTDGWIGPSELADWSGITLRNDRLWQSRLRLVYFKSDRPAR
ncbi:hypothetical protein HGI30_10095 [Paenibacillus albicereus]|uniref:Uncharacterized protein n=1 Tax=Paenibacillus albicereus TaxID=2726185 RepID=A0A6H2GWR2_9BACL|nr:hypothetical protein [Paenibacillus albicereus]QJC51864.1 hypothetical protein HGI30_10095 [Paenibacillus albicereus]